MKITITYFFFFFISLKKKKKKKFDVVIGGVWIETQKMK